MLVTCSCIQASQGVDACSMNSFFLFKQKTAYEMRISDWSSDVCSSDLMLVAASLVTEDGQWQALQEADFWGYFAVIYQSVVVVAIGYGYWYWLMRRYQMNQIMPATLLVPPFGVLSGVIFLGESLTLTLIAGGLMTIVGVGIIILRRPNIAPPEAERLTHEPRT